MPHPLSPLQTTMPKDIRQHAFKRLPETCEQVRHILWEAQDEIQRFYGIPAEDIMSLDHIMCRAFQRLRDEVTHRFRDEQMLLLKELDKQARVAPIGRAGTSQGPVSDGL